MVSAPFGNIDLQPAYDYLGILDVSKLYMLETAKYHFKLVNELLPTQISNWGSHNIQNVKAEPKPTSPS